MRNDITIRGKYMYPHDASARMVRLVRAGLIDLTWFDLTGFRLEEVNDAVAHATAHGGPFQLTVLRPS